MELKSLLLKEHSPTFNSITSRGRVESFFRFPTIDKCRSIDKLSQKFSKKVSENPIGKSKILSAKQTMLEILNGIKDSSEKGLRIKLAFKALEHLTKDSGLLQKELSIITKELFDAIYCEKNKVGPEMKEWIYEKYDFSAYDKDNTMPLVLILEYWKDAHEKMQNAYNQLSHDLGVLREELEFKSTENAFLRLELENHKENKEDSTKETLQETNTKDFFPKERLEMQNRGLNDIIEDLYGQLHHKEVIIRDQEASLKQKLAQCKSLEDSKKKYSESLKNFKSEIKHLRDANEKLKEKIEQLNCEKTESEEVKSRELQDRGNLTLRPDYESFGKLLDPCPDTSTKGRVKFLLNLISGLKIKKLKKNSTPGIKKKPYTDLPTPYRKQQSYIISN